MAKSLEQLLKQRKWTGEDAGQLYLYSSANDIVHDRKREQYDALFDQEFFNRVTQKIPYMAKEQKVFNFYQRLDLALTSLEQIYRYYEQNFFRYAATSMLLMQQMESHQALTKKIELLNVSDEEKKNILDGLVTPASVSFSDDIIPYKMDRTLLFDAYKAIKIDMCFFYCINFVYDVLFEHIDFEQLSSIKIDMNEYEKYVKELNKKLKLILEPESEKTQFELRKYFKEIDFNKCRPHESDKYTVAAALGFSEDPKDTLVENIQDVCINLANTVFLINGGTE